MVIFPTDQSVDYSPYLFVNKMPEINAQCLLESPRLPPKHEDMQLMITFDYQNGCRLVSGHS